MTQKTTTVLLHGFTGSKKSWARCPIPGAVSPPILGHGGPAEGCDFDAEVDRLAEAVRAAPAPRVLLGYSLGARLALGLMVRHTHLFERAILVGVHPGLADSELRAARVKADAMWAHRLEHEGLSAFVEAWERVPLFASQQALPAEWLAHQREIRLAHDARGLAASLRVLGLGAMPPRWDAIASLAKPLELVVGARDEKFLTLARRVCRVAPSARLHVVPDVGHNVVLEAPHALLRLHERLMASDD